MMTAAVAEGQFTPEQGEAMVGTKLLPTPTAQEVETPCEVTETGRRKSGKDSRSLNVGRMASMGMLPTPMAQEHDKRARQQTGKTSQLSPLFVEEMMGFPKGWTASPFQSGDENP
jgi:hypothetical protein